LRKALVVGQFVITVALIIGSFVVYKQIRFLNAQDLGMNISQMLVVNGPELVQWDSTFIGRENSFTEELKQVPHVSGAATSQNIPGGETGRSFNVRRSDQDSTVNFTMRHNSIGIGYLDLYKIKILAGRDFTYTDYGPRAPGQLRNLILNESAVKLLGFPSPQEAVGKTIIRGGRKWEVIGVINDYHQKSLHYPVEPGMFWPYYSPNSPISIKVDTKDLPQTIASIRQKYAKFFPGNIFDYSFLDERFNAQYSNDRLLGKVFAIFSGFAIFIACLGLLGLSLFTTAQRTKEIGVRKVLGASVSNIVVLLSKDFVKLVLLAFLIASPLAWWIMNNWLQDFAYRINISGWIFLGAGTACVDHFFRYHQFACHKSSGVQSGEKFEDRVNLFRVHLTDAPFFFNAITQTP
jgi:putative ABC transport system permease protein